MGIRSDIEAYKRFKGIKDTVKPITHKIPVIAPIIAPRDEVVTTGMAPHKLIEWVVFNVRSIFECSLAEAKTHPVTVYVLSKHMDKESVIELLFMTKDSYYLTIREACLGMRSEEYRHYRNIILANIDREIHIKQMYRRA